MSQDYKYADEPLSFQAAIDILKRHSTRDEAIKKGHPTKVLQLFVEKYHTERGGFSIKSEELELVVQQALYCLSRSGHANPLIGEHWRLPKNNQRIFGNGIHWVYLYYFKADKDAAETQGKYRWRCRIGRAKTILRVGLQDLRREHPFRRILCFCCELVNGWNWKEQYTER